ncbi:MAG TPA: glycosyltransferase family 2 protein [Candidatus Saccharimonadales bacterium]|nr:glycosyltransferase family 2 protein [Candidatus Saccharimonadales bacterium]
MIMAYLIVITTLLTLILVTMTIRLRRALRRFRIKKNYTAAIEAPSVSVCIPARNETHAMTQCLERVLASDYRKLEVVVYDDSSTDDTSILVRSFAHAGVRFVPGDPLPDGWLGKNYALDILAREASGTYVIFMDVDTFIKPTTISQLVGYMMTENLTMSSVIPGRSDAWRVSVLFGHLRYFWEVIMSRMSAPATSSSLWMIKRHELIDTLGGFAPHKNEVEPEEHIASIISTNAYHCLIDNQTLGVTYEKKWSSQAETSRRLLFPMVGGSWYGALIGFAVLLILNLPFLIVLSSLFTGWMIVQTAAFWMMTLFMGLYAMYTSVLWTQGWWMGGLLWPVVVMQELALFVWSVWSYNRRSVTWKGRSVTTSPVRTDLPELNK